MYFIMEKYHFVLSPSMNVHNTTLLKIWNSEERKQMMITNLLGKRKTMKECKLQLNI